MALSRRKLGCLAAALIGSALLTCLVPAGVIEGAYQTHVAGYRGVCGPHAPDIPEHPCSRETYIEEFWGGFSGMGVMMIGVVALGITALSLGALWLVAGLFFAIRKNQTRASP